MLAFRSLLKQRTPLTTTRFTPLMARPMAAAMPTWYSMRDFSATKKRNNSGMKPREFDY